MINVLVTALHTDISIQDPRPVDITEPCRAVWDVPAGTTRTITLSGDQLERLAPLMERALNAGYVTFEFVSSGGPLYAENPDSEGNPVIDAVITDGIDVQGGTLVLLVKNLLGNSQLASLSIPSDLGAGQVLVSALSTGMAGNTFDVVVTNVGGGGLATTSSVILGRTVIDVNRGGDVPTCTQVAASIEAAMAGEVYAEAVGTAAQTFATNRALAPLTGGTGLGLNFTLGGVACVVTEIHDLGTVSQVVLAVPSLEDEFVGFDGAKVTLQLRTDNKTAEASLPVKLSKHVLHSVRAENVSVGTPAPVACVVQGLSISSASIPGVGAAGSVLVCSERSGIPGNTYDLAVIQAVVPTALGCVRSAAAGRVIFTVTLSDVGAGNTCDLIAAAINGAALANEVLAAVFGAGATEVTAVRALAPLSAAFGTLTTMTLAGIACTNITLAPANATGTHYVVTGTTPVISGAPISAAAAQQADLAITANGHSEVATMPTVA